MHPPIYKVEDLDYLIFELNPSQFAALPHNHRQYFAPAKAPPAATTAVSSSDSTPTTIPCFSSISTSNQPQHTTNSHKNNKDARITRASSRTITPTVLPVGTRDGSSPPRCYVWTGTRLKAMPQEEIQSLIHENNMLHLNVPGNPTSKPSLHTPLLRAQRTLHQHLSRWLHDMHTAFFPDPHNVTSDYWNYVRWRASHRLFSSMSSIFATQSLLLAVGVGAKRSLPAAATINWVLKDGLGRLGRLTVATRFGESFDSDLKV